MRNNKSFVGLLPLFAFIFLYLGTGIYWKTQGVNLAFYQLPAPIAMVVAIIFAFIIFKGNINDKFNSFLSGCGHHDIVTMCIIYLLAGAFATVCAVMGAVSSTVNLGLTYIPSQYLVAGIFILSAFISTATGTSVGTISTIAPIAIGLADKGGLSLPLILAAVMGGAMFGDNLSIISDTTIAAVKTQGATMKDKFKTNFIIVLPAAIITIILFIIFGKPTTAVSVSNLEFNIVKIIPYIFVLALAISGVNVFVVLVSGTIVAGIIGIIYGDFSLLKYSKEVYSGFSSVFSIFLLSLLTGGLASMITKEGGIEWIMGVVEKFINSRRTAKLGIGVLTAITDLALANNTIAILINGDIAKNISEKYSIAPKDSATIMDIFSCVFQGALPYGAQMLILLSFANGKVSPIDIMPLLWYQGLLLLFTILFILLFNKNSSKVRNRNENKYNYSSIPSNIYNTNPYQSVYSYSGANTFNNTFRFGENRILGTYTDNRIPFTVFHRFNILSTLNMNNFKAITSKYKKSY